MPGSTPAQLPEPHANDRSYGPVTVLFGQGDGRYPDGNSLLITGTDRTLLVDPSLTVHQRGHDLPGRMDGVLLSHVHEDHIPGLHHFTDVPVAVHQEDFPALASMEGLMAAYGYDEIADAWEEELHRDFHVSFRPDADAYTDGARWDLGGVSVTAHHLPGHTAGHCALAVEPGGFLYLADIELTGFGPYYGDATSDLTRFEASLASCRELDARWYATFHHKGVLDGREAFLAELAVFTDAIARRDRALVDTLANPHTLEELVKVRFFYRPHVDLPFVDLVERRGIGQHLAKLVAAGRIEECEPGRWRARADT